MLGTILCVATIMISTKETANSAFFQNVIASKKCLYTHAYKIANINKRSLKEKIGYSMPAHHGEEQAIILQTECV